MSALQKLAGLVAIALLVGLAVASWVTGGRHAADVTDPVAGEGPRADAQERLIRLEQMVLEEREARFALEDRLAMLVEQLDALGVAEQRAAAEQETRQVGQAERLQETRSRDRSDWARDYNERRVNRMVEHGLSEDEARYLLEQESAASYEAMRAAWEAQRDGQSFDPFGAQNNPQRILRESIGDAAYERYLEAQDQPTSVEVTQVLSDSPGERFGLEPGDRIARYNGERVFSVYDLRELTMQGNPGEDVVIEIVRDGVLMQLTLPAGPIGITGAGARARAMNWWGG